MALPGNTSADRVLLIHVFILVMTALEWTSEQNLMASMALPMLRELLDESRQALTESERRSRETTRLLVAARRELAVSTTKVNIRSS